MDAERRKDIGFGESVVSFLMLIVSVVVGAFNAAEVFAGRSPHGVGR
jgi:hypothetical protein